MQMHCMFEACEGIGDVGVGGEDDLGELELAACDGDGTGSDHGYGPASGDGSDAFRQAHWGAFRVVCLRCQLLERLGGEAVECLLDNYGLGARCSAGSLDSFDARLARRHMAHRAAESDDALRSYVV